MDITIEIREDGKLVAQAKIGASNGPIKVSRWREPMKVLSDKFSPTPEEHIWASVCHLVSYLFAIEVEDDDDDDDDE